MNNDRRDGGSRDDDQLNAGANGERLNDDSMNAGGMNTGARRDNGLGDGMNDDRLNDNGLDDDGMNAGGMNDESMTNRGDDLRNTGDQGDRDSDPRIAQARQAANLSGGSGIPARSDMPDSDQDMSGNMGGDTRS
jgi:hypothetical protein